MTSSDEDFLTADEAEVNRTRGGQKIAAATEDDMVDSGSDSESDDEAPEEVSLAASKQKVQTQEDEILKAEQRKKKELKEKRRLENERNIKQKESKKVAEELPIELLEAIDEEFDQDAEEERMLERSLKQQSQGRKTVFSYEDEDEDEEKNLDKQIRKTQKRIAKEMSRKTRVVSGITVSLQPAQNKVVKLPPAAASSVTTLRSKWLKRNSLKKKRKHGVKV